MIERQQVNGRDATVSYLTDKFGLADKETATLIKVAFDNGEVIFLVPAMKGTN